MTYLILFVVMLICLYAISYMRQKGIRLRDILLWRVPWARNKHFFNRDRDKGSGKAADRNPDTGSGTASGTGTDTGSDAGTDKGTGTIRTEKTGTGEKKAGTRNGTRQDVALFVNRLLRFADKKNIKTVIPGMIRFGDTVTNITAIIVAPGEVLGMVCLGFGGRITPDPEADKWEQELNGVAKMFPNPLKNCSDLENVLRNALREQNIQARCRVVPVFTTPDVVLTYVPQGVYTVESLFYTLDDAAWIEKGNIDTEHVAEVLTAMVPVDELRTAAKDNERAGKRIRSKKRRPEKSDDQR